MITVTEKVIHQLRELILDGSYMPGRHLQEEVLATDLSVSRTPVRDALRVLANEELLIYAPNRGYIVRKVELQDVLDVYDIRGALEGMACRVTAERGVDEDEVARLEAMIEEGERIFQSSAWGPQEQAAWRALNAEFHFAIADFAHNRQLGALMRHVRRLPRMFDVRLEPESDFYQEIHTRDERRRAHGEHVEIVRALMRREGARAEALMREHIYRNREVLRRGVERSKLTTDETV